MAPPLHNYDGVILNDADWRARVAVLEIENKHMSRKIDEMSDKLDNIHDIIAGTRTAKWIFLGALSVIGFIIMNVKDVIGLFK
jgi:hypothetical protein